MTYEIRVENKNVNSDLLANDIKEQVTECIDYIINMNLRSEEDREQLVESTEYILMRQFFDGRIITYKTIMDKRNNKRQDISRGKFRLDIKYQEKHCLNVTQLNFFITENVKEIEYEPQTS